MEPSAPPDPTASRDPGIPGPGPGEGDAADEGVDVLAFDVFGTVTDWRTSIVREGRLLSRDRSFEVDWEAFADAWRAGYRPALDRVRRGEIAWATVDELHRMILDDLLQEFGISGLPDEAVARFNRVWHRLIPWPDAVAGLNRLRSRYLLATLSNGNVSLLTRMARHAGLPWDCILSAELAGAYKPDPEVYRTAADLLDVPPRRIMMVAAHEEDLRAAARVGFRTAWVPRPLEHGPGGEEATAPDPGFDVHAPDFLALAERLGA